MENHPIPQDITGFQFKLIGNMTVKQFAYLAAGTVIAWFFFFIMPVHLLVRLPLAVIFLGLGVSLAFVPIDGRPMDTMIKNLIKAIFAPTQYIYKKTGGDLSQPPPPPQVIPASNPLPQPQIIQVQTPQLQMAPAPQAGPGRVIEYQDPVVPNAPPPLMSLDEEEEIIENEKKLEEQVSVLEKELEEAKDAEGKTPVLQAQPVVHQKTEELERLLTETVRQKEELEKEFLILKAKLEGQKQEKFNPTVTPLKQPQRVRKIPRGMEKSVGLPTAPQDSNVITGILKDPRGNPLPNILVEVKDIEDNPVRAFKTNGLGQFASATQLSNGKYIVTFEDPGGKNKFDAVEIEAVGTPLMPLEILSVDPREELRRQLFAAS